MLEQQKLFRLLVHTVCLIVKNERLVHAVMQLIVVHNLFVPIHLRVRTEKNMSGYPDRPSLDPRH